MSTLLRGAAAGAVGTTVLNAATYLDMALTGRAASSAPSDVVHGAADLLDLDLPDDGSYDEALGALAGLGVGVGIGVVAGAVRSVGVRLPLLAEAAVIGAGAMAATDGPMAVLGVTDMTTWTSTDWVRDVVPHVAYGVAVAAALRGLEPDAEPVSATTSPAKPSRLLARSLAIGLASGARSTLGLLPPALTAGPVATTVATGLVGAEVVVDKLPAVPSRLGGPAVGRVATGAGGAAVLARQEGARSVWPAVAAGALGAVAGTLAGSAWRGYCSERDWAWQGAVTEDLAALALTAYAWKG